MYKKGLKTMKVVLVFLPVFLLLILNPMDGMDSLDEFNKYPVKKIYSGKIAPINFSSYKNSKKFKTVLSEGLKNGSNFAGKYRVIEWGCGTNCTQLVVVNVQTGDIISWLSTCGASRYKLKSYLLVVNPKKTEHEPRGNFLYPPGCELELFVLKNNKLCKIK